MWRWVLLLLLAACVGDPPEAELTAAQRKAFARYQLDAAPADHKKIGARFGDRVTLLGFTISGRTLVQAPGREVTIELLWQVDTPLEAGWRSYAHLRTKGGDVFKKLDARGPLRSMSGVSGTPYPPSRWIAGKVLRDPITFTVPADAPDELSLVVGFYRGGERLDADAASIPLSIRPDVGPAVPALSVPRRKGDIVIDGALDDAGWRAAAQTTAFVPETAAIKGRAKLSWDEAHLYFAFVVADGTLRGGFPQGAVDPHLWTRDTIELMIDPDGDGDNKDYYEIQINPQNLIFDSRFDDYNQPRGGGTFGYQRWRANIESAVALSGTLDDDSDVDKGYIVEARLPWSSLIKAQRAPPRPGDTWRMNFYAMQNNGGVAWSPILGQGNFHRASRFGRVTFAP